ncbi:BolA family protein [Paradevosia shaoguanensis]|uniref:BolA family transcriptional regulator n=1 Tax=Paradevosia shaoguanensis TaxID=1335043 RepID=A0AA41QTV2_9HYPH|nr:BolA family protein [Paradevosia shaoguanensis]MBI4047077.1 BolA family transcriptional regulator [Devosia nanyangense]QMV00603.1 BolA/IbaG family iron-sulfur metabolism protein [Devosia sp. D6-9]CDP51808.1 Cell division protein BolA [Devosia sp. DBB001]MCF1745048.1 BolA family transcriptional regulator [Paradevosia shaoguanensis]MCI0129531.1 BolA family transcriptional regulator [Paradevosia shaoguanensis]
MSVRDTIIEKLSVKFAPEHLEVIDDSHKHRGHAGWREGGETHFRVRIATRHFDGMTRLAQHRAVMEALDAEIKGGVHALAIEVLAPGAPKQLPRDIA